MNINLKEMKALLINSNVSEDFVVTEEDFDTFISEDLLDICLSKALDFADNNSLDEPTKNLYAQGFMMGYLREHLKIIRNVLDDPNEENKDLLISIITSSR